MDLDEFVAAFVVLVVVALVVGGAGMIVYQVFH